MMLLQFEREKLQFHNDLKCIRCAPHVWHGRCPGDTPIPAKPSQACLVWRSRLRCWCALAILVVKLQTFLFQMVVTSYIYVQHMWKYGFAKSSDNLYAPCIMMPVVLYGYETWGCLRTGYWGRDEVTGEYRKLHNEELYGLYCSSNIIWLLISRRRRRAGHVVHVGEERCMQDLVGKIERKRPLVRPTRRWEDNIEMNL